MNNTDQISSTFSFQHSFLYSIYSLHLLRPGTTHHSTDIGKNKSPMASAHTAAGSTVKPS